MMLLAFGVLGCRAPVVAEGTTAFSDGRLEEAVQIWSAATSADEPSGVLAYDLGTAWYRKGDPARAIGWLRAAARLRPRDGNVHHNLSLARADLGAGIPEPVGPPAAWMAIVTPGEIGLLGILVTVVGSALLVATRRWGGFVAGRPLGLAALAIGLCSGGAGVWGAATSASHPAAVVLVDGVAARDGPAIDAGVLFTLPAGTEVRVERSEGPFLLFQDGRARRGWIPRDAAHVAWGPLRTAAAPISVRGAATPG